MTLDADDTFIRLFTCAACRRWLQAFAALAEPRSLGQRAMAMLKMTPAADGSGQPSASPGAEALGALEAARKRQAELLRKKDGNSTQEVESPPPRGASRCWRCVRSACGGCMLKTQWTAWLAGWDVGGCAGLDSLRCRLPAVEIGPQWSHPPPGGPSCATCCGTGPPIA